MSSLLVIGGSGFFGKSILDAYQRGLLQQWHIQKVFILSRNAQSLVMSNPHLLGPTVQLINGDISQIQELPYADYVIHAAASTDASKYLSAGDEEKNNIIIGTKNFTKLAKNFLQKSKIVYVSSGAVYGSSSKDKTTFKEDDLFVPILEVAENKRDYAAAKRDSEAEMIDLSAHSINVSIARCFAFVGRYLPRDQHFAIGNFIQYALDHQPIKINAQHLVYRSYMYADDMVQWLLHIANASSSHCPIFNVGSDVHVEMGELGQLISQKIKTTVQRKEVNSSIVDYYVPSIAKAKSQLNLELQYPLEKSIDETIRKILA